MGDGEEVVDRCRGVGALGAFVGALVEAVRREITALEEQVDVCRGGAVQRAVALREEEGSVLEMG